MTTVETEAKPASGADPLLLRSTNTQLRFAGFRQVYVEARDDDDSDEEDMGSNPLPQLAAGDALLMRQLFPEQHFTEPPPRYTDASLVKALEEKGIGRPSTYAPTMSTIQDRGYVGKEGRNLKPTDLGIVVNDLLVEHFPHFVDAGFTANMEEELDEVASGEREWQPVVREMYDPLEAALTTATVEAKKQVEETTELCPECGAPMVIRWGRRGRFLACTRFPECRGTSSLEGEEPQEAAAADGRALPGVRRDDADPQRALRQVPGLQPLPGVQGTQAADQVAGREVPEGPGRAGGAPDEARPHVLRLRQLPEVRLHNLEPAAGDALPQLRRPRRRGEGQQGEVPRLRVARRSAGRRTATRRRGIAVSPPHPSPNRKEKESGGHSQTPGKGAPPPHPPVSTHSATNHQAIHTLSTL